MTASPTPSIVPESMEEEFRRLSLSMSRVHAKPRPSIVDIAEQSGLLALSPSDLVCESSASMGCSYYDYVISSSYTGSTPSADGATLYLAKFDANVNLESLESTTVAPQIFTDNALPETEMSLAVLGMLTYKREIGRSRVLLLVRNIDQDNVTALEAMKRIADKFKCLHHVQVPPPPKVDNGRTCAKTAEGMRLRVMLCQTRSTFDAPPASAVREAKALLEPSSNPLLCLCFSLA